jgi:hypothetical protein
MGDAASRFSDYRQPPTGNPPRDTAIQLHFAIRQTHCPEQSRRASSDYRQSLYKFFLVLGTYDLRLALFKNKKYSIAKATNEKIRNMGTASSVKLRASRPATSAVTADPATAADSCMPNTLLSDRLLHKLWPTLRATRLGWQADPV